MKLLTKFFFTCLICSYSISVQEKKLKNEIFGGAWYIIDQQKNELILCRRDTININYIWYKFNKNGSIDLNIHNPLWDNSSQPILIKEKGTWTKNIDTINIKYRKKEEHWLIKKIKNDTIQINLLLK